MFKVKTNICNDNGAMRANVRSALHGEIEKVVVYMQGEPIVLEKKANGEFFAPIAVGTDDKLVNAKVDLSLTIADYQLPKPRIAKPREKEEIVIEKIED